MNEQLITDTAEHCDFYVGNEHYDKSYEEQQRLWVNKFAELIVRECMDICRECIKDGYDEAEEPRGRIKDRFGVEE